MKKYNKFFKIISVFIVVSILALCFTGCKGSESNGDGSVTKLSFKEKNSIQKLYIITFF